THAARRAALLADLGAVPQLGMLAGRGVSEHQDTCAITDIFLHRRLVPTELDVLGGSETAGEKVLDLVTGAQGPAIVLDVVVLPPEAAFRHLQAGAVEGRTQLDAAGGGRRGVFVDLVHELVYPRRAVGMGRVTAPHDVEIAPEGRELHCSSFPLGTG